MENENLKPTFKSQILTIVQNNKKKLIIILCTLIISVISTILFNIYKAGQNKIISEKFIEAGILLSSKNLENSKKIYEEIILSKNKFYSPLALNTILENNLEKDSKKIINYFEKIEELKIELEQKNLVKIKKALYLIKINKNNEGEKLLKEIISDNSIWKNTALEILK